MKALRTVSVSVLCVFMLVLVMYISANDDQIISILKGEVRDDTISDLAYDKNKKFGYTVYVKEEQGYAPYLVLTKNYNEDSGNVLLLRKDLLNEQEAYHSSECYYGDSLVDKYLRERFLPTLNHELRNIIINSEIEIAESDNVIHVEYVPNDYELVEKIHRQVFLLSFTEMGFSRSKIGGGAAYVEGKPLKYFKKSIFYDSYERRFAYRNGELYWYLLRTPVKSGMGSGGGFVVSHIKPWIGDFRDTTNGCGIRPAFCLPPDIPIKKEVIDGEEVYVLVY